MICKVTTGWTSQRPWKVSGSPGWGDCCEQGDEIPLISTASTMTTIKPIASENDESSGGHSPELGLNKDLVDTPFSSVEGSVELTELLERDSMSDHELAAPLLVNNHLQDLFPCR